MLLFQLHVMDSDSGRVRIAQQLVIETFQLHVMDSNVIDPFELEKPEYLLSTPCNGFPKY